MIRGSLFGSLLFLTCLLFSDGSASNALFDQGRSALLQREFEKAEQIFSRILESNPNSPTALSNLAIAKQLNKKFAEAFFLLQDAVATSGFSQNPYIRFNLGKIEVSLHSLPFRQRQRSNHLNLSNKQKRWSFLFNGRDFGAKSEESLTLTKTDGDWPRKPKLSRKSWNQKAYWKKPRSNYKQPSRCSQKTRNRIVDPSYSSHSSFYINSISRRPYCGHQMLYSKMSLVGLPTRMNQLPRGSQMEKSSVSLATLYGTFYFDRRVFMMLTCYHCVLQINSYINKKRMKRPNWFINKLSTKTLHLPLWNWSNSPYDQALILIRSVNLSFLDSIGMITSLLGLLLTFSIGKQSLLWIQSPKLPYPLERINHISSVCLGISPRSRVTIKWPLNITREFF